MVMYEHDGHLVIGTTSADDEPCGLAFKMICINNINRCLNLNLKMRNRDGIAVMIGIACDVHQRNLCIIPLFQ